jgi:hypothetical protein
MRPWTRLQDNGALIAGVYTALSPIWVSTTGERGALWAPARRLAGPLPPRPTPAAQGATLTSLSPGGAEARVL